MTASTASRPTLAGRVASPEMQRPPLTLAYHGIAEHPVATRPGPSVRLAETLRSPGAFLDPSPLSVRADLRVRPAAARADRSCAGICVLTFDDGSEDNATILAPILRELGVPATLYVCPGLLGQPYPWMRARGRRPVHDRGGRCVELSRDPLIEIGSHTREHALLADASAEEAYREMAASKRDLEELLDLEVSSFAYPRCKYSPACPPAAERAGIHERGHMRKTRGLGAVPAPARSDSPRRRLRHLRAQVPRALPSGSRSSGGGSRRARIPPLPAPGSRLGAGCRQLQLRLDRSEDGLLAVLLTRGLRSFAQAREQRLVDGDRCHRLAERLGVAGLHEDAVDARSRRSRERRRPRSRSPGSRPPAPRPPRGGSSPSRLRGSRRPLPGAIAAPRRGEARPSHRHARPSRARLLPDRARRVRCRRRSRRARPPGTSRRAEIASGRFFCGTSRPAKTKVGNRRPSRSRSSSLDSDRSIGGAGFGITISCSCGMPHPRAISAR